MTELEKRGWRAGKHEIDWAGGAEKRTVKGFTRGSFGLRDADKKDRELADSHGWTLTHLPSGRRVIGDCSMETAADYADYLDSLDVDWEKIKIAADIPNDALEQAMRQRRKVFSA